MPASHSPPFFFRLPPVPLSICFLKVYVYARNARFFASDDKANDELLEGNTAANRGSTSGVAGSASASIKVQVPSTTESPGLTLVIGNPFPTPTEGSYAVVFFFATWCSNCERCLPAFLALASRYSDEGTRLMVETVMWYGVLLLRLG